MARRALCALVIGASIATACGGGLGLFRQYEYEEELYLSLDGSATMYVNSSVAAMNALRGTAFDLDPAARIDRAAVRDMFAGPNASNVRVTTSRRNNRQFVHVRLDVADVRRLPENPLFRWSTYRFARQDDLFVYLQNVEAATSLHPVSNVGWTGREIVAFRLHLPSKIAWHNTGRSIGRGNILVWEQSLTDRQRGVPLVLDARMETQSILYRTLWLFGWTFVAVAIGFGLVIWWVLRRGPKAVEV